MFSLNDIAEAHKSVKTWADFPLYARTLKEMGVTAYDTFVSDGHAVYLWNDKPLVSLAKYEELLVAEKSNREAFIERLKLHQSWGTDYMTFCRDCAENGVEKWTLDMKVGTCTYFDRNWEVLIVEHFPKN